MRLHFVFFTASVLTAVGCTRPPDELGMRLPARVTLHCPDGYFFESLAFSADGKFLAGGGQGGTLRIWQTENADPYFSIHGKDVSADEDWNGVLSIAFRNKDALLAWAGGSRTVPLLDVQAKKIIGRLGGHESEVRRVQFSPNSKWLVTATWDGQVRLWDLQTQQAFTILTGKESTGRFGSDWSHVNSLAFSPDNSVLAIGLFRVIVVLTIPDGKLVTTIKCPATSITTLAFDPNGKRLISALGKLHVWDTRTWEESAVVPLGLNAQVGSIAFSPDGKTFAALCSQGVHFPSYVRFWDTATLAPVGQFICHDDAATRAAWTADGKTMATTAIDRTLKLWDAPTILERLKSDPDRPATE